MVGANSLFSSLYFGNNNKRSSQMCVLCVTSIKRTVYRTRVRVTSTCCDNDVDAQGCTVSDEGRAVGRIWHDWIKNVVLHLGLKRRGITTVELQPRMVEVVPVICWVGLDMFRQDSIHMVGERTTAICWRTPFLALPNCFLVDLWKLYSSLFWVLSSHNFWLS